MILDSFDVAEEALNEAIYKAALQVADKMVEDLKQSIQDNVYDVYTPTHYTRVNGEGDFYNSWMYLDQKDDDGMTFEILQDYTKMVFNPDMWQHGSPIDGDARQELATYIANGIVDGAWGNFEGRDFWTPFIDKIHNHEYDSVMVQALQAYGLDVFIGQKYHNVGLKDLDKIFT